MNTVISTLPVQARSIVAEVKAELECEELPAEALAGVAWTGGLFFDAPNGTLYFEIKLPGSWAGAAWYTEDVRGGSLEPEDIARLRGMGY